MRSENYTLVEQSFLGPLGRAQKVRAALVEGLKPGEQQEIYIDLVKHFNSLDPSLIDKYVQLFSKQRLPEEEKELEFILSGWLSYRSTSWRDLDYDVLRAEDVVRDFKGSLGHLVELALETPEHIVFSVAQGILPDEDYKKHIRDAYKLKLDSKEIIASFAQRKGFQLSDSFYKRGYLTKADKKRLEERGFTFSEALKEAVDFMYMHESKRACVLTFTRSNGDETRLFPYSVFVEAPEHFLYFMNDGDFMVMKDYALKQFTVPKRYPEPDDKLNNLVEISYVPDFERNLGLEWRDIKVSCDCEHAIEQRNFKMLRGAKKLSTNVADEHVCSAILFYLKEKGLPLSVPNSPVKFFLPSPMRAIDFLRYNVYGAYEEHGKKGGVEGREDLLNNAIPELFRQLSFRELFGEFREDSIRHILRKMH